MSTSVVAYKGHQFWMHSAVAEVWFSAFVDEVRSTHWEIDWLAAFANEAGDALDAGWVTGIAMNGFDEYVKEDRIPAFLAVVEAVNSRLLSIAHRNELVQVHGFCAASAYLIPEVEMLGTLVAQPGRVPSPSHVYVPGRGWEIA